MGSGIARGQRSGRRYGLGATSDSAKPDMVGPHHLVRKRHSGSQPISVETRDLHMYLQSDRAFQIWTYSVSHGQLLVRSPKSKKYPTNVDVSFFGVKLIDLSTGFIGLTIEDASPEEITAAQHRLREPSWIGRVYRLTSESRKFFVAAVDIQVSENSLDFRETELDFMAFVKPGQRIVDAPP